MTERKTIGIDVYEWDEDFSMPAIAFIEQLRDLLDTVPEEYRPSVVLQFDRRGDDYDYSQGELTLSYERQETDEEFEKRTREDLGRKRRRREAAEAEERALYARLKEKYEK